ncbi:MAG: M23 family metallopeptidase [Alistipes sp.]|nr:M23 family metallopeptidase [Candidatus Alistipes equi]
MIKLRAYFLTIFLAIVFSSLASDYCIPISNVRISRSASFAEFRPGHFHGGLDFRTFGQIGKPVLASADGYVWRITLSPAGYGLGLYVRHPKLSTMTVYGHLSRLETKLQKTLDSLRESRHENICEYTFAPSRFPVKQGDVIAFSGNTGSSFGPHLHFEIRSIDGNTWFNPISMGMIPIKDNVPPLIKRLRAYRVDSLQGVAHIREEMSLPVKKRGKKYSLAITPKLAGNVFFVLETLDREAGSNHRFGIHDLTLRVDGREVYSYKMDAFYSHTNKYVDAVSFYPLQLHSRCEVVRLARERNVPKYICGSENESGLVHFHAGMSKKIQIAVSDASGNSSLLEFVAKGVDDGYDAQDDAIGQGMIAGIRNVYLLDGDFSFGVPAYSFFSPARVSLAKKSCTLKNLPKGSVSLGEPFQLLPYTIPLRFPVTYSLRASVPFWKWPKVICLTSKDGKSWRKDSGWMFCSLAIASSSSTGHKVFVLDEQAPVLKPFFNTNKKIKAKTLCFSIYESTLKSPKP